MQAVLLKGFGTALTGTSRTLDFLTSFSDGSDGFSGSDFLTGLDGFSGFFRTCSGSSFGLDRFGFSGFSGFGLILRSVFQDLVFGLGFFNGLERSGFSGIW